MKNYSKTILLLLATLILLSINLQGQTREVGARFTSFDSFSFLYKKEIAENKFLRNRLTLANFALLKTSIQSTFTINAGIAIGIEKRKAINEKMDFIHGIEPALGIVLASSESRTISFLNPSLGYVLGLQYRLNESFHIGIETIPALSGTFPISDNSDTVYTLNLGFNSNAAAIVIVYRFDSKE